MVATTIMPVGYPEFAADGRLRYNCTTSRALRLGSEHLIFTDCVHCPLVSVVSRILIPFHFSV